ncbi:hypothetical protein OFDDKENP_00210 [Aeromonas phage B614]|nr:hypothetical protein OFDDKENP_00210 [Aeromonas phage B614]UYD58313.1 hypothetical protein JNEOFJEA_00234 [Aeromonas phage UP87]UYD58427.1 hypothetical protein IPAKJDPM_00084 [Aeromonas phage avDM14-QBC]UYD58643.1 hypothetical protein HNNIDBEH_00050 [Aeromonas phage avDM10-HWA]UYD59054.1 hypothetical protein OFOPOMKI_00204 [Aeromonas phage avDM7-IJDJ]UYD59866.1 hypothetical protein LEHPIFIF_00093 [Aeromonas phage avDM9-HANS]
MNGWGPSDEGFSTRESTIKDAISWARLEMEIASKGKSNEFCDECDEEIPVRRRELIKGCKYCVRCQSKRDFVIKSGYNRRGSKDSQLR